MLASIEEFLVPWKIQVYVDLLPDDDILCSSLQESEYNIQEVD
jgi:hypothetical protein